VLRPDWWSFRERYSNGHEWGWVIVSWMTCSARQPR